MGAFDHLTEQIVAFRDERDWKQFHSPKNLVASVAIEAGELLETLQWVEGQSATDKANANSSAIAEEAADVAIYLLLLCNELGIALDEAIQRKIALNKDNYPSDLSRGTSERPARS